MKLGRSLGPCYRSSTMTSTFHLLLVRQSYKPFFFYINDVYKTTGCIKATKPFPISPLNVLLSPYLGPVGMKMLGPYQCYNPKVKAASSTGFSGAAFRYGHGTVNNYLAHSLGLQYKPSKVILKISPPSFPYVICRIMP